MNWILYSLLKSGTGVIKEVSLKKVLKNYDPVVILFEQQVTTFLIVLIFTIIIGANLSFDIESLIFLGIGVITSIGSFGRIKAININLSASAAARSFSPLFPTLLAVIFLGEAQYFDLTSTDGILRLAALVLSPLSVFLIRSDKLSKKTSFKGEWVLFISIMILGHGLSSFFQKYFLEIDNVWKASTYIRCGGALASTFYLFLNKKKWELSVNRMKFSIFAGLMSAVSTTSNRWAILSAPLSIIQAFKKPLEIVSLTIIGLFGFGEKKILNKVQKIGFILSLLSLALILISSI